MKLLHRLKKEMLFGASLVFLIGCSDDPKNPGYEFMPDMYRSPSYETYSASPVTDDAKSAMLPVEGTVARGPLPYEFPNTMDGYNAADTMLSNPIAASEEVLAEGETLYLDFCSHCHGKTGEADGKIIELELFPAPPKFNGRIKD